LTGSGVDRTLQAMSPGGNGRRRRLALSLGALLAVTGGLGAIGLRALVVEARRAETGLRERAEGAARAVAAALEARLAAAAAGETAEARAALVHAFAADARGRLVEPPAPAGPAAPGEPTPEARQAYALAVAEAEAAERDGRDLPRAAAIFRLLARDHDGTTLGAAALTALAAVERKRGEPAAARAALEALVARYPGARDGRGLRRAFAARLLLAEMTPPDPLQASGTLRRHWPPGREVLLVDLQGDLIAADHGPDDRAVGNLKAEVRRRLEALAAGRHGALLRVVLLVLDHRDASLEPERRLRAAFAAGAGEWLADGAPGGALAVADGIVAARTAAGAGASGPGSGSIAFRGALLDRERFLEAALHGDAEAGRLARLSGFEVEVGPAGGGAAPGGGPVLAVVVAPQGLGRGLEVRARAGDIDAFRRAERRRLQLAGGLAGVGLLVAVAAAIALLRAVGREVEAARRQRDFVAAVTHELKTPLASIRLLGELVQQDDMDPGKRREFQTRIVDESERLARHVTRVLDLARIERGEAPPLELRPERPEAIAAAAVAAFAGRARAVSVRERAEPGLPAVLADRDAIVPAVLEMLENAAKHGGPGDGIDVELARSGNGPETQGVEIAVLDRGPGVPAGAAERIFEPFYRVGDELTRERPGVGLGLALVREVARRHGGRAGYAPRAGGGARFFIALRAAP